MRRKKKTAASRRRTPRQARARNTVEIILEATTRILEQEGRAAVTTNRIAERAGVGISTVYEYFENKEAILVAVARQEMELHRTRVVSAMTKSIADSAAELDRLAIRALIDASGKRHRARRAAIETLIAEGLGDELAGPITAIADVVAANSGPLLGLERMSPVSLFVLTRAIQGVVSAGLREESPFFRSPEFEDELVRLTRAYLAALDG